jgi:hypothetical protein
MTRRKPTLLFCVFAMGVIVPLLVVISTTVVFAQSSADTTFTYQGRLLKAGDYVDGVSCDFQFDLYETDSGGSPLTGTLVITGVAVTDGYFTTDLNFGDVFDGNKRYLAVTVRCPPDTGFTALNNGRVELNAAPYAVYAMNSGEVDWTDITNIPPDFADNIDNNTVDTLTCDPNQTLKWDGFGWTCENPLTDHAALFGLEQDDHEQYLLADGSRALTGNLDGGNRRITNLAPGSGANDAVIVSQVVISGGVAGGDLSGTYPDPNVTGIQGRPVISTAPQSGQVLGWQGGVQWAPISVIKPGDAAGGDLSGTYPDPTVARLQGVVVSTDLPQDGQILKYDDTQSQWAPADTSVAEHHHFGQLWDDSATTPGTSADAGLEVNNTNSTGNPIGLYGRASGAIIGTNYGVWGESASTTGRGVYGQATSGTGANYGVYGEASGDSGRGVYGVANASGGYGVYGSSSGGVGVYADGASQQDLVLGGAEGAISGIEDVIIYLDSNNNATGSSEFMIMDSADQAVFRVEENNGDVYADGGYHCGININDVTLQNGTASGQNESSLDPCLSDNNAADFAEMLPAIELDVLEAGDVLTIDQTGALARSFRAYQSNVAGVYSTRPSYVGNSQFLNVDGYVPLALVGVVPVKASAENGSIQPGDMLVASDTPGHAMRAGDAAPNGTVIGKALAPLEEGVGLIQIIVMLQ